MFSRRLLWPLFWVIMGFALGGSVEWAISQPNQQAHISAAISASNSSSNQHQPSKTFGQRLSVIWDRTWEDPVAFYTFVLGLFTFCLVAVSLGQGYFLFRSDRTARIAANAAKRSADAAIALELPIIRAEPGKFGYGSGRGGSSGHQVWISAIWLANIGKTKAFPIELQLGHTLGKTLPEIPAYPLKKPFPVNAVLTDQQLEFSLLDMSFEVPADTYDALRNNTVNLWLYCNLVYLDFMQNRHEAGFCWERYETIGMGRLRPDPTQAYNRKT